MNLNSTDRKQSHKPINYKSKLDLKPDGKKVIKEILVELPPFSNITCTSLRMIQNVNIMDPTQGHLYIFLRLKNVEH